MITKALITIFVAAFIDVLIKELYVKNYLWKQKWGGHWWKVNRFWKDKIENDYWYRIRYAIVLNLFFMVMAGILTLSIWGSLLYIYLGCINLEHIFYQWIAGFIVKEKKLFDLHDTPTWMEALPWNKALARHHGEEKITSEEIYTVTSLGVLLLWLIKGVF